MYSYFLLDNLCSLSCALSSLDLKPFPPKDLRD
jgi:hypothetical protein